MEQRQRHRPRHFQFTLPEAFDDLHDHPAVLTLPVMEAKLRIITRLAVTPDCQPEAVTRAVVLPAHQPMLASEQVPDLLWRQHPGVRTIGHLDARPTVAVIDAIVDVQD